MSVLKRTTLFIPAVACLLTLSGCQQQQTTAGGPPPAVPVSVSKVTQESVPTELRVVGTVEASSIVQVKSQVAGELIKVAFTEGQNVAKGDLLFQIDPRPFQDAMRQAEAAVTRDRAQIAQSEAALSRDNAQARYNQTDADRYAELQKEGLASKSQFDQSKAGADVAREAARVSKANIDSARAALEADVAAVAAAKLNLDYCTITAPIAGRTGNLLVHAGNLVKVNDVALVIIHQVSPIFVNFSIPEQHLAAIRRLSSSRKLSVDVVSRDNPDRPVTGTLSVIDNAVDSATGTIHLKATFENKDRALWPGQFVTAVLTLDTIQNATVIPAEAVQAGQQGSFVYLVKANNTVETRPVTVTRNFGKKALIESGVVPGDTVVVDGQLRLFPGAQIKAVEGPKDEGRS
ncbi:MAG TPA: efflux RND transporter periplasmic adaptor subunit [Bryobacteraceae bacterium]|nr:efflux RND transporter periplasmic adaptor subunit [Bryobacteraceae bacterium]